MKPFSRRLADAACAFQTGHSVRDLDRVWRRRIWLHAQRYADRNDRDARQMSCPDIAERVSSEAAAFREAGERYLESLDRRSLTFLLKAFYARRIYDRSCWRDEAANLEFFQPLDDAMAGGVEATRVPMVKFPGKLFEGFLEKGGFNLGFDDDLIGRWNSCQFFHFVIRSIASGFRSFVRSRALAVVRACGPP